MPAGSEFQPIRSYSTNAGFLNQEAVTPATVSLSVNISSRAQSRAFFNAIYSASDGVPSNWTGTLSGVAGMSASGSPGSTSSDYKSAVQLRINWFRAMAGLAGDVGIDDVESAMDQQAALMMSANNSLNHFPPSSWLLYTADGATAAGRSNLSLGSYGPDAITGYINDFGSNNYLVGHRRWILFPQTKIMATGDVPALEGFSGANAMWTTDANVFGPRPVVRDNFVAWPPAGYVPYQVVFPRWSISYPGADFSKATVAMYSVAATTGTIASVSVSVPVVLEPQVNNQGYGENTLVWDYNGLDSASVSQSATQPSTDVTYTVQVRGVVANGASTTFSYSVTLFDPAVAGVSDSPATITASNTIGLGQNAAYMVGGLPAYASGFQYRSFTMSVASAVYGAEGGLQGVIPAISSTLYNAVDSRAAASGSASYHLAMPDFTNQALTLPGKYVFQTGSASLVISSLLGWATPAQVAHVQISLDDGVSWTDIYTQAGTGTQGETNFAKRSFKLDSYAGQLFMIRFTYTLTRDQNGFGSAFTQTTPLTGWYIDAISFSGVQLANESPASVHLTGTLFGYTPDSTGQIGLQIRPVLFGNYPLAWNPVVFQTVTQNVTGAPTIVTQPNSQIAPVAQSVTLSVSATSGTALSYQWTFNGASISGATSSTYTIPSMSSANAGTYAVMVTNSFGPILSKGATLSLPVASLKSP